MTLRPPLFMDVAYNPEDFRFEVAGTTAQSAPGVPIPGVIPAPGSPLFITRDPNVAFRLVYNPGQGVIRPVGAALGAYRCTADAPGLVLVSGANASFARIDLVVARVYNEGSGGRNEFTIEVIQGIAAAGTPAPPAAPPGSIPLATVTVPPGVSTLPTNAVNDARFYTVAPGGSRPVTGGVATDPGYSGQLRYLLDRDVMQVRTSNGWTGISNTPLSIFSYGQGNTAYAITANPTGNIVQAEGSDNEHLGIFPNNPFQAGGYVVRHSLSNNSFRAQVSGFYRIYSTIYFANNSTGSRALGIRFYNAGNTSAASGGLLWVTSEAIGNGDTVLSGQSSHFFDAGDVFAINIQQTSGVGLTINRGYLQIEYLGG